MVLYQGLPILTHCYREFVNVGQHCVRQRFAVGAARRAPARPAASSTTLSCLGCSTRSGCPAPAAGGLAESQPFASATPQPHAARMPRGGLHERDVDRAAGRRRARGWASRPRQPRQRSRGRARAAPASSRPPVRPASIEQRHRVSHGTRRRICSRSGKGVGSMREGCAPSARRDASNRKCRRAWTPSSSSLVTWLPPR